MVTILCTGCHRRRSGERTMAISQTPPRAEKARQLLQQCSVGLEELRSDARVSWFVLWSGTLGLLRTVGEALKKDADMRIRRAQNRWFDKMKRDNAAAGRGSNTWEPAIFWQFIRRDRNLLLHEGQLTASQSAIIQLSGAAVMASAAGEAPRPPLPPPPPARAWYSYPMRRIACLSELVDISDGI
jgi:hypothetical protein